MGEHKYIRCEDCNEYSDIGKLQPDYGDGAGPKGDHDTAVRFLVEHKGCSLRVVGEYGGTQGMWMDTDERNGWTPAKLE